MLSFGSWASQVSRQRSRTPGSSRKDGTIADVVVRKLFWMGR